MHPPSVPLTVMLFPSTVRVSHKRRPSKYNRTVALNKRRGIRHARSPVMHGVASSLIAAVSVYMDEIVLYLTHSDVASI